MTKQDIIAIVLGLFFISGLFAQGVKLDYSQKLTITEGLAHNGVTSMLEDSKGFLWFGTYEGINKYDGYELKTFKNTVDNSLLTSNRVRSLNEDKHGNLWIGTDKGLTIYKYSQEQFEKFSSDKLINVGFNTSIIRNIVINEENELVICITENNGLFVFNENDYSFLGQYKPKGKEDREFIIFKALQIDKSHYLISTSVGLFNFDLDNKTFIRILESDINYCNSVIKISNNSFLVTLLNGVAIINKDVSRSDLFHLKRKDLDTYQFNSSFFDAEGNLWLGTLNEGIVYINDVKSFELHNDFNIENFTDNLSTLRSSCFISTSNNDCWFATFNEGIYRFDVNKNPFHSYYSIKNGFSKVLASNTITHITAIDKDKAILTSSLGGLTILNTQTRRFEPLPFQLPQNVLSSVSAVYIDSKENIWLRLIGESGLIRFTKGSNSLEKVANISFPNSENLILRSFGEDSNGNIWIASSNDVYKIVIDSKNNVIRFESLSSHAFFKGENLLASRRIFVDPLYDFIWIGTQSKGLIRIKNKKDDLLINSEIEQYKYDESDNWSLSSNFVSSIVRLPNDDLWIGTEGGGICKVLNSESKPKFISFTEKNGLSNNVVKGMLYDANNNLWVSTNIGMNLFNTQKKEFRKFNISDGLAFEDFWYSTNRFENGTLMLSGLDGFIYFNPKEIPNAEELPKIQFENFKIFNRKINPGDTINKRVVLSKRISEVDEVILKHNENVFSLDFTSLHFLNPKNHSLKYRLLPFNDQWIEVPSNQKTINYSGLQPGSYKLSVMASNSLNDWTEPKTLNILIKPSIWNTNVAYILYTFFGIVAGFTITRVILKIQRLSHEVEIDQLEKNKFEELNEAKLRFFSNISHEIKTPLTLISRPLEILKKTYRNNPDANKKFDLITRQSKKILQLIEQVQDFRRADAHMLKMEYSRFNFDTFLQDLIVDFKFLADNDDKKLEIISGDDSLTIVSADKDKLEKVFNNLLNNAFKYTRPDDYIKVEYRKENEKDLIVKVIDTGKGIDSVDLTHVFERFYQSQIRDNTHMSGSGIGLAFSKRLVEMHYGFISAESIVNEGTTITVRLPIIKKHLPTDVLDNIDLPNEKEISVSSKVIRENKALDIISSRDFQEAVIFYAEDNLEMRVFVSNLLSKFFKVKSFRNGKDCFEALEDEWPDIVISDVQMPELNGLDLCLKIKSDLKTSHIPVILLTALTNIEDHLQGIKDGADAYIKKPFNVQHLITNVEALLTIRKQLQERYQVGIPLSKENNKNNRNDNAFLEKLYSLIEENIDNQDFDLNNLARELYLNRTHFYQKVKALTNQTPFELLKMYRLKKAAELLIQKGLSVNEVFMLTGFKSRTHFAKVFKEKYNTSPGKFAAKSKRKQSV